VVLCEAALAVLLVIGGVEQNPGPSVEAESIMKVLCSGLDRNLKLGTHCGTCGRWFYNGCGNVKTQVAESGKWIRDRCRWEKVCLLWEKLQTALLEIEDVRRKNKRMEEQLTVAAAGSDNVQGHHEGEKCIFLGDSVI
jgi:hypothetical protein